MRKGFTLLELIVVIIILGVLATLGFTQYSQMIEKARGAEAKSILGDIRKMAAAYRLEYGNLSGISGADLGMQNADGYIPTGCRASHYFSYCISASDPTINITATRCTAGGKPPQTNANGTVVLSSNLDTGVDAWSGTGAWH
jgi:prepilin-type N-terminal cleavage/methylation domain-containing protein